MNKKDYEQQELSKEELVKYKDTNQQREGWSKRYDKELAPCLDKYIFSGALEHSRIKSFIKETLETELHERDKDWQKLFKEAMATERERVLGEINIKIKEKKERIEPLKKQYDLAYKKWFNYGHRDAKLEKELKGFESGTDGNTMATLSDEITGLEIAKEIITSLKEKK